MTNPLTTPSGVDRTVPIPRSADGSPLPRATASAIRAKEQARQDRLRSAPSDPVITGREAVDFTNAAFDKSTADYDAKVGPLSPEEAERRLRAVEDAEDFDESKAEEFLSSGSEDPENQGWVQHEPAPLTEPTPTDAQVIGVQRGGAPVTATPAFPDDPALQKLVEDSDGASGGFQYQDSSVSAKISVSGQPVSDKLVSVNTDDPEPKDTRTPAQKRADTIAAKKAAAAKSDDA